MKLFTCGHFVEFIPDSIYGRSDITLDSDGFYLFNALVKYNKSPLVVKSRSKDEVEGEYAKLDKLFK